MNSDRALPAASSVHRELGAFVGSQGGAESTSHQETPFVIFHHLHRLLRGRYILALSLASIGAIAGATGGYLATKPKYMSVGSIHVVPVLQKVMYDVSEKGVPQMFNSYVRDQANYLQEPRVISMALGSKEWLALGRTQDPDMKDRFLNALQVATDREEPEWIRVRFLDRDPHAAKVAVEQIIEAYTQIWGPSQRVFTPEQREKLSNEKTRVQNEINEDRAKITAAYPKGMSNLEELQSAYTKQILLLESDLDQITMQIQQAEITPPREAQDQNAAQTADPELINAEIAKGDPEMGRRLDQRMILHIHISSLEARGFKEAHPALKNAVADLAGLEKDIALYREQWLSAHGGAIALGNSAVLAPLSKQQIDAAKSHQAALKSQLETYQERTRAIAEAKTKIDGFNSDIKKKQEEVNGLERRIAEIDIETPADATQNIIGRIQIISKGEEATHAYSDPRKKLAALGFCLGGAFPVGLILLVSMLDRRYRYSDDASASGPGHVALLGILPYLPENMHDPEQAAVAAHCVHQIRTLLQIGGSDHSRKVFAITSPTSGDGKTSLALSLGLSFAASGARTLLIDFDMIGSGLTSAMQARTDKGLLDAIDHGQLNGHVRPTAFPGLWIVPAGEEDAQDVSRLSPVLVRRILDQARKEYDTVVIDTGPILGSLEAALVTAEADGVILALGRGQQRFQVERAINHLANVGAKLIGVVFNRAQPGDFRRAVSSASVRSVPVSQNGDRATRPAMPKLGPMASTVASHIRSPGVQPDDF